VENGWQERKAVEFKPQKIFEQKIMAVIKRIGEKKYLVRVSSGTGAGRIQKARTFRGTKKAAKKWADGFEQKLDTGYTVEEITQTLNKYLDNWLENVAAKKVRLKTLDSYNELLKIYIRPKLGEIKLSELKAEQIQAVYDAMSKRGLSSRTVDIRIRY